MGRRCRERRADCDCEIAGSNSGRGIHISGFGEAVVTNTIRLRLNFDLTAVRPRYDHSTTCEPSRIDARRQYSPYVLFCKKHVVLMQDVTLTVAVIDVLSLILTQLHWVKTIETFKSSKIGKSRLQKCP